MATLSGKARDFPAFFVGIDFIIPFIDLLCFRVSARRCPGVFGHNYIVGPLTSLVMPLALLIVLIMFKKQKAVFTEPGLKSGVICSAFIYMLVYQALMSPIA